MILVVDASVVVDLLVQAQTAAKIEAQWFSSGVSVNAPDLLRLEVIQVLRRWRSRGHLTAQRADEAFDDFCALDIRYYDHASLLKCCWSLKDNLTTYDASYLALAELLDAKLLTKDNAFAKLSPNVEIIGDGIQS